mmetsp:Transcript_7674/g.34124  ORF Transcript_7674/g.34124 Transcript_7674/m.34124 type:complete len:84 (+) Transcript_7674:66-317(+)
MKEEGRVDPKSIEGNGIKYFSGWHLFRPMLLVSQGGEPQFAVQGEARLGCHWTWILSARVSSIWPIQLLFRKLRTTLVLWVGR